MEDRPDRSVRLGNALDYWAATCGGAAIAAFSAIIVYVVFARYVLSYTPRWSEELPRLLLVWVTFIGAISGFVRRSHLSAGITDLLVAPGRFRNAIAFLAMIATAAFLLVLLVTGWNLTMATWSHETTVLSLPVGLVYLALPVTACFSLVAVFVGGWRK
ncbi:TRAP-type C4-dicarboxylate transport system permease small subunit [Hoeflea marina]|uniref:TRAP transporter small permease protein n=1 Tax=Hoeflea marina TaxID=274592 RepID=A0A317PHK3_9HYPH|nr:TRAP transporter small permease [Hoeflea marina]PWV99912.1 TRAP-type C4-dicarboxylate transport system permease small subunit [Hoeflea marina]